MGNPATKINAMQKGNRSKSTIRLRLTCFCLMAIFIVTRSQGQSWQWGNSGGADDNLPNFNRERVISMCTASDGSSYCTSPVGRIDLRVAGNPKPTYAQVGLNDWVIAGFSCEGDYKWSKVIGGYSGSLNANVGVDSNGNVYAAVTIRRTPSNVSPAPHFDDDLVLGTSANNVNTFKETIFLIKYDSNGNYLWSVTPQAPDIDRTTGTQSSVLNVQVDSQGNSFLFCSLMPSTYCNGQYTVASKGFHMIKYDNNGNFMSAFPMDMTAVSGPYDFKLIRDHSNGRFYVSGLYDAVWGSQLSFGGEPVTHGKFLAAFDASGALLWEKENTILSNWGSGDYSYGVAVDPESNVYFTGSTGFEVDSPTTFDSFNGVSFDNLGSPPWPFIVKLDPAGNTLWQTNGTESALVGVAINGDEIGVSYGANHMSWQGVEYYMPGGFQPYIARFQTANGQIIGIHRLTTTSNDAGTALTADPQGNYYLGGRFGGSLTAGADTVTSNGGDSDFFIAKFGTDNCNLATESFNGEKLEVYPNPVQDKLYLTQSNGQNFKLFNSLGLEVMSGTFAQDGAINVESLASGIYLMQVLQDGQSGWVKVVKL